MVEPLKKRHLKALIALLSVLFMIVVPIYEEELPHSSMPSFYAGDTIKCNILLTMVI